MTNEYITAIDLGSSKITGVVAQKTSEGKIIIHACEQDNSKEIRCGEIKDPSATAYQIVEIVKKLNNNKILRENKIEITKMNVGLGGNSLKTNSNIVKKQFDGNERISSELIAEMEKESEEKFKIQNFENDIIYKIVGQEFIVDGGLEQNPVGLSCSSIIRQYKIIHGKPELQKNLNRSFEVANDSTGLEIAQKHIAAIAAAESALTKNDKKNGCVIIDFGAETTSVCVYFNGILRHLAVIGLGGNDITNDIKKEFDLSFGQAEKLKFKLGNALSEIDNKKNVVVSLGNGKEVSTNILSKIIKDRLEEILDKVWQEVEKSKLASKLENGIIITGGASNLKNLDKLISRKTGKDVLQANYLKHLDNASDSKFNNLVNAELLGLLLLSNVSCTKSKEETETISVTPRKNESGRKKNPFVTLWGKIDNVADNLFAEDTKM
jgi:cell division protein FtsA